MALEDVRIPTPTDQSDMATSPNLVGNFARVFSVMVSKVPTCSPFESLRQIQKPGVPKKGGDVKDTVPIRNCAKPPN